MNKAQEILNEFDELDEVSDEEKAARKAEREEAVKFSKEMKKKFEKDWGAKVAARVLLGAKNPWIEFRIRDFNSEDVIPNEFRLAIADAAGFKPLNREQVTYGNITKKGVSMQFSEWKEMREKGVLR